MLNTSLQLNLYTQLHSPLQIGLTVNLFAMLSTSLHLNLYTQLHSPKQIGLTIKLVCRAKYKFTIKLIYTVA